MGRELQKKKNRSSIPKLRHKPKSKKRLLNHPIIAANWDKSKTLEQNYRRLGLTTRLNKITGGVEKHTIDTTSRSNGADQNATLDSLKITPSGSRKDHIEVGEAQIERDPETGKIIRVLDSDTPANNKTELLNDPLADLDSASEDEENGVLSLKNQHGNVKVRRSRPTEDVRQQTEVVRLLEEQARRVAPKKQRKQPEGEREFVEELVRKYGENYTKMARDVKINYMQRSEGDIKRRIKRWRESGGTVDATR